MSRRYNRHLMAMAFSAATLGNAGAAILKAEQYPWLLIPLAFVALYMFHLWRKAMACLAREEASRDKTGQRIPPMHGHQ